MSTKNRPYITYLPQVIEDKLTAFMAERNLGASKAIATILNLYFNQSLDLAKFMEDLEETKKRISELEEFSRQEPPTRN